MVSASISLCLMQRVTNPNGNRLVSDPTSSVARRPFRRTAGVVATFLQRVIARAVPTLVLAASVLSTQAATDKIIKVLPQYLDSAGRDSVSPSLYDRDAYQAQLRAHPRERSGIQFKVQWRARSDSGLTLRLETRGTKTGDTTTAALEVVVQRGTGLSKWAELTLKGEAYTKLGDLKAWRVTLWDGEKLLAEQKSFLW
jgi:hypothetical protein